MTSAPVHRDITRTFARVGTSLAVAVLLTGLTVGARAATGPVPVVIASDTPVEVRITVQGSSPSFNNLLYTVPIGKMLVVDSVSVGSLFLSANLAVTAFIFNGDPAGTNNTFTAVSLPASNNAVAATQPTVMRIPPLGKVVANLFSTGSIAALVSLSGHLVDAP